MKKYMKYLALCAVVAMGGYVTKADANFITDGLAKAKNKIANAVDECNAGAGASPKGLKVGAKCLADEDKAKKNKNFAAAYWGVHCAAGNEGGEGDAELCGNAVTAMAFPEGFTGCIADDAASDDKKVQAAVTKYCLGPKTIKLATGDAANEGLVGFYTAWYPVNCGEDVAKKHKSCKAVLKAVPAVAG